MIDRKENIEPMHLACIEHHGNIAGLSQTFDRLMEWAVRSEHAHNPGARVISIFHHSVKTTDEDQIHISACLEVDSEMEPDGEIGYRFLDPGMCLLTRQELRMNEFEKAWIDFYAAAKSEGRQWSSMPPFEIYYNDPRKTPGDTFVVDLCLPIVH